jgi:TetR/AcrR family fatty acid metabolism transcriptional regulator
MKMIIEKGYQNITVEDIAKKAGVAKGTLYLYFKNKDDIFINLVESFFAEAIHFIEYAKEIKGNSIEKLKTFIRLDLKFYEKNHRIFKLLGTEIDSIKNILNKRYREKILKKYLILIDSIAEIIKGGIKERKIIKMPPGEGALILVSIIHAFAGLRVHELDHTPLTKKTEKVLKIFLKGVGL